MKILVVNSTGNVGKSFIAREVLYPLLSEEKTLYEIEKFNEGSAISLLAKTFITNVPSRLKSMRSFPNCS